MKSFLDYFFGDDDFFEPFTFVGTKDNDHEHSYYHCVSDKYENGKRTSHIEKEVKDGKVLKDVKEENLIEPKEEPKKLESCCKESPDELKTLKENYAQLRDNYKDLGEDYKKLEKKLDTIEELYNKVKRENDNLKKGIKNLIGE